MLKEDMQWVSQNHPNGYDGALSDCINIAGAS
jgi:hypothetical protein